MKVKDIPITLSILYTGLKNDWITPKIAVSMVNDNKLGFDEEFIIDLNVNDSDKSYLLNRLSEKGVIDEDGAVKIWYLFYLIDIEKKDEPISLKLKEIESLWARFDYPNEWREFISYLPNETTNSPEGIYKIFLNYTQEEKKKLNLLGIGKDWGMGNKDINEKTP